MPNENVIQVRWNGEWDGKPTVYSNWAILAIHILELQESDISGIINLDEWDGTDQSSPSRIFMVTAVLSSISPIIPLTAMASPTLYVERSILSELWSWSRSFTNLSFWGGEMNNGNKLLWIILEYSRESSECRKEKTDWWHNLPCPCPWGEQQCKANTDTWCSALA